MNVSVVIPTFNKAPRLKLMLASAVCQDFNLNDAELLLVDDGSTDETNQVVAEYKDVYKRQHLHPHKYALWYSSL